MTSMARRIEVEGGDVPLPLYHRIYVVLRQQIAEGRWEADAAMPSEHELASTFAVSRITIRRALDRLEKEKLISRRRGSGTFAQPSGDVAPIRQNLSGLLENLLVMGLKTSVRVLDFSYLSAPAEVAAALEIPPRTTVQKSVRVRLHRDVPFSFLTTWVPEDVGRKYKRSDLARRPLLALLEDAGYAVSRADQVISAKLADTTVAQELRMEVGAALLYVRRQVRDPKDRVVEYIQALYRPELYEYHMGMRRVSRSGKSLWSAEAESAD
ncbi:GntR family transcriptional regulator [Roseomonas sp. BN140053]|uniref:GntR family transcriptional regulator n=1 Tax=Roseomonas sp. BN140053 TaxID=3391898 RepID=UPI0039E85A65